MGIGCPKHVQKKNKYTKQNCAPSWIYLQDYTRMHGQRNLKYVLKVLNFKVRLCLYISRVCRSHRCEKKINPLIDI